MRQAGKIAIARAPKRIGATDSPRMIEQGAWCNANTTPTFLCAIYGMLIATFVLFNTVAAHAEWPDRPITFIVPYSPGSISEFFARTLQLHFSSRLNATFVVENRPGASGMIGLGAVARAKPDGYTFGLSTPDLATIHVTKKELPFEFGIGKTLVPVTQVFGYYYALLVHPDFPAKTLPDLIALIKANPKKYKFGSAGDFAILGGASFATLAGLKIVVVPFNGAAAVDTALLGGHIDFELAGLLTAMPLVLSGKLRALGVTSPTRLAELPDVFTLKELYPSYEYKASLAVVAPGGTPPAIIEKMRAETIAAFSSPEVVQRLKQQFLTSILNTPEEMEASLRNEIEGFAKVARDAGIEKQ
jgi:tripartite-type tricarboxylate transporter receptor subunit TctC